MKYRNSWTKQLNLSKKPNFGEIHKDPDLNILYYKDDNLDTHLHKLYRLCTDTPKENVIVTGDIGVGKTTFIHYFKDIFVPISKGNKHILIDIFDLSIFRTIKDNEIHPDDIDLLEYNILNCLTNFLNLLDWDVPRIKKLLENVGSKANMIHHIIRTIEQNAYKNYKFIIIFDEIDHYFSVKQVETAVKHIFRLIPHNSSIIKVICARKNTEEYVIKNIRGNFISKYFNEKITLAKPDFKNILIQRFRFAGASGKVTLPFSDKLIDDIRCANNENNRGMLNFCKVLFNNTQPKPDVPIQTLFNDQYIEILSTNGYLLDLYEIINPHHKYAIKKELLTLIKFHGLIDDDSKSFLSEKFGFKKGEIWHANGILLREDLIRVSWVHVKEREGNYLTTLKGDYYIKMLSNNQYIKFMDSRTTWLQTFSKTSTKDISRLEEIFKLRDHDFYKSI